MSDITRIIITGGGTGGHIYPALATAQALKKAMSSLDILYVGTRHGNENKIVPEAGLKFKSILIKGMGGNILKKLESLFLIPIGCLQALFILLKQRPNLIVGTGGYVSFPVVFVGKLLGIKSIILEQNVICGKTTKILAKWADKVLLSFPDDNKILPEEKTVVVGNPVRQEILEAVSSKNKKEYQDLSRQNLFGLNPDLPTVLITGGSQGAKSLNEAVMESLSVWKDESFQVIHLTGNASSGVASGLTSDAATFSEIKDKADKILAGSKLKYLVYPYYKDIWKVYLVCDLVVSRAGATALAEITVCGLPAVLVPYPYSAEKHQDYNAKFLESKGACVVISDKEVKQKLAKVVLDLIKDKNKLKEMADKSLAQGRPNALENVLAEIIRVVAEV